MSTKAQLSRDRILDAAAAVLVREGATALTIAAVAAEAGVSKGGLFYHFASKELLVEGLAQRYVASFDALIVSAGDTPGAATRAYLASAEVVSAPASQPVLALLAAAIVSPGALALLRERYRRWQKRLDRDGVGPELVAIIRFTVDGMWLADAFDLAPASASRRRAVLSTLRAQLDSEDQEPA